MDRTSWPLLGCGIGLRSQHYPEILKDRPRVDWFEAVTENYMDTGGRPLQVLEEVRRHYPVALHGTALSIGSADPLSEKYLSRLKTLTDRIQPALVTDHLCWSGVAGQHLHDLLPLPLNEASVRHVVSRVGQVQELLGRRILLENVSTYVTYKHSTMTEWDFLVEIARRSGCGLLLDLNNVYVNSVNHRFDPSDYLRAVPAQYVGQIHLAGHTDMGDFLFDTHSKPVLERVWDLYREALGLWGPVSTLIEWDEDIPGLERLLAEARKARAIYDTHASVRPRPRAEAPEVSASASAEEPVSLYEVQELIRGAIQFPQDASGAIRGKEIFNPQAGTPGVERLAVYAGGYSARLHEALSETFMAVRGQMGEELFAALCHVYAARYPSHDYNLNFAGRYVPDLLKSSPILAEKPYLYDLARLEWQAWESFHAYLDPPMSPEDAASLSPEDWEKAQLFFQQGISLFSSSWALLDLWLKRQDPAAISVPPDRTQESLLIGRRGDQVRCERLHPAQYRMLEGLLSGRSLGAVCEELAEAEDESGEEMDPAAWFGAWIRDGLVVRAGIPAARLSK